MIATVDRKRCVTGVGIFCIIKGKFSYWKELYPVILCKVDKGLEVSLYNAILPLGLTVCLRVERGRESLPQAQEVAQGKLKV